MVRKEGKEKSEERQIHSQIEDCLSSDSEAERAKLGVLKKELSYIFKDFREEVDSFKLKIAKMPLPVFILTWADLIIKDKISGEHHVKMMHDILESEILLLSSLEKFSKLDPSLVLDNIRCFSEWTLEGREDRVATYKLFAAWLSQETFGYVPEAVDLDHIASQKRQVPFETYINILSHLDLRERILAKMFYLGGSRGLEEVLSVKIDDVDFKKGVIRLEEAVSYPRHLFDDIREYAEDRKRGYVFMGKDGERISHTTSFRALKKVVLDLKLDPEFTFKELTRNL
jgi:integrase